MTRTDKNKAAAKEKARADKESALRLKPLISVPTEGSSRQQVLASKKAQEEEKRRGKKVVTSTRDESDEESEEEPAPPKKARKSNDESEKPYANRDRDTKPNPEVFLDFLKNGVSWPSTRFGDTELMEEIGIDEDVKAMLGNMHMPSFYSFAHPTYIELSCEFLSSLVVTYHQSQHVRQGWGKVTFKVRGRVHNINFKDIGRMYGLRDGPDFHLPKLRGVSRESNIPTKLWELISGRKHSTGSDKNSHIRNPAIRYLHRMLVHAFFPRKEPGTVTEEELRLLCLALKPFAPEEIPFDVSELYKNFGMVGFFVSRLEYYRDWAWTTADLEPQIGIGGMITPLLERVNAIYNSGGIGPTFLDGTHMKVAQYFSGRHMGSCVYTYKKLGRAVEVVLPKKNITGLTLPGAVAFDIGDEHFLGPHGKLAAMAVSKRRRSYSAAQYERMQQAETAENTAEEIFGPPRYYFETHAEALAPGPLREAHEHIDRLQRWNKAQDRAFYKLKTKYKDLKKTMKTTLKKVTDVLVKGGVAGCSSSDFVVKSTSAPRPQRASQQKRDRRNFVPPPSDSGNKSPSLTTSDDDSGDDVSSTPMDQYSAPYSHYNAAYTPYGAPYDYGAPRPDYYITYPDCGEPGSSAGNPDDQ